MNKHTTRVAPLPYVYGELLKNLSEKKIPFYEIRHKSCDDNAIYSGDIDFFTSSKHINTILEEIFKLATLNQISCVIDRRKYIKTKIILLEHTCKMITLEIWTHLEIKDPFKTSLNYIFWEDFQQIFPDRSSLGPGLPLNFEALYYLSHLCTKKKNLQNKEVIGRITHYKNALEKHELPDILRLYASLSDATIPSVGHEANLRLIELGILRKKTFKSLFPEIKIKYKSRLHRLKTFLLRRIKFFPVVGPDGVGKTTTIQMMVNENKRFRYYRFKKTFRKSLSYKLMLPFLKKTATKRMSVGKLAKNQVDDHFGGLIFYISLVRYYLFVFFNIFTNKVRLSDRFFHDFLFENLRFNNETSKIRINWNALLKKIPSSYLMIQLNASPEIIVSRKNELSEKDITFYRDSLFRFYMEKKSVIYYCIDTTTHMAENKELYNFLSHYV